MGTTFRFSELRRLHSKGFTLLWIKPRSKAPVNTGWTKQPRTDFDTFKKSYRKGFNVGVRLGEVSRLEDGGYLAVIDLDVKGTRPEHQSQAKEKLYELFPAAKTAPCVVSGRGNGSAHYYVSLDSPLRGNERKSQSREIVKVLMPSVEPSRKEKEQLTPEELTRGIRLRPAWEISLLCEGRQVVLPGSVHPDSGRRYAWAEGADLDTLALPRIEAKKAESMVATIDDAFLSSQSTRSEGHAPARIQLSTVDVENLGLRPDQVAQIVHGVGVTDRSASIFALTMAMLQRRVSEADILSVFTDRRYYLGQTAFDHAKTTDRIRAARWLQKYTLPRAKAQVNASAFAHEVKEEDSDEWVDEDDATPAKAAEEVPPVRLNAVKEIGGNGAEAYAHAADWKFELDLQAAPGGKGAPPIIRPSFKNLQLILTNDIGPDFLRFDDFAGREFWAYDVPWGPKEGDQRSAGTQDEIKLKSWLIEVWGVEASINLITETLAWVSGQNHFHPVKDYLESLEWDGVPRIDDAFKRYLGAKMPKAYLRAVSRKFFLALIARIYEPGCKFDHLPVLEGKQGIGKSTFGRILVGDKWFMDGLPDLSDKDAALNLQGIWLCEMSELSSLYRSQLEVAKAFITRQVDKVRPPYGARRVELPRSTVFVGTTNDRDYLVDSTGNRRFWPVLISGCDFEALIRDREQLLAEAHWCYLTEMEPLFLQGEAKKLAEVIQESRRVEDDSDAMATKFREWLALKPKDRAIKDITRLTLHELFSSGPFVSFQPTQLARKQAGAILRRAGYRKISTRKEKVWVASAVKRGRPKK